MVKVMVEYEEIHCDECGAKWGSSCEGCGKDLCAECRSKMGWKDYQGMHGSGRSMVMCPACLSDIPERLAELVMAYQALEALQMESKVFHEKWTPMAEAAEKLIWKLRGKT